MADLEVELSGRLIQEIYEKIVSSAEEPRTVTLHSAEVKLKARVEDRDITVLVFATKLILYKIRVSITPTRVRFKTETKLRSSFLPEVDAKIDLDVQMSYNETEGKIEFKPATAMLPLKANLFGVRVLQMVIPPNFTLLKIGVPLAAEEFSLNFPKPFGGPVPIMVKSKKTAASPAQGNKIKLEKDFEIT